MGQLYATRRLAAACMAILCSGCAFSIVTIDAPDPVPVGGLVTFNIAVTNDDGCTLNDVEMGVIPLAVPVNSVEECNALCGEVDLCEIIPELCDALCELIPEFCERVRLTAGDSIGAASLKDRIVAAGPAIVGTLPSNLRQRLVSGDLVNVKNALPTEIQQQLASGLPVTSQPVQVGSQINCQTFPCALGNVGSGQSVQVTTSAIATQPGMFCTLVSVSGTQPATPNSCELEPTGQDCVLTTVLPVQPAPALSARGLAAAVASLVAIGGWRLRRRAQLYMSSRRAPR